MIRRTGSAEGDAWDAYVRTNPRASVYHLFGWKHVIENTYRHTTHYIAQEERVATIHESGKAGNPPRTAGVLPLIHMKHPVFGNSLVSVPFLDGGGALADSADTQRDLVMKALDIARGIGAATLELRQELGEQVLMELAGTGSSREGRVPPMTVQSGKVRMLLSLPENREVLMSSFKSKLRSQIAKPIKEGLVAREGGTELLDDFYRVFLVNMRDLGSPVHSIGLMRNVLAVFPDRCRVFVVYKGDEPVAASIVLGFNGVLRNPWASSLRKYSSLSPNMLLYLRMLEYACDQGYSTFDFGRSTPGEGTYRFKEQWGARPAPLYWHRFHLDGRLPEPGEGVKDRFSRLAAYWQKLPVPVTRFLGPRIRKHISL